LSWHAGREHTPRSHAALPAEIIVTRSSRLSRSSRRTVSHIEIMSSVNGLPLLRLSRVVAEVVAAPRYVKPRRSRSAPPRGDYRFKVVTVVTVVTQDHKSHPNIKFRRPSQRQQVVTGRRHRLSRQAEGDLASLAPAPRPRGDPYCAVVAVVMVVMRDALPTIPGAAATETFLFRRHRETFAMIITSIFDGTG
jgi:hypothetical protein